jgi:cytoskeleton protein RodZ
MSDQPTKSKHLFDEPDDGNDVFAAVSRGDARLGEVLAEMRTAHGLELADVSRNLLIREQYLAAIERGDLGKLPGPTYAIGFVRSYADFLGLDGEAAVKLFKNEREGAEAHATLNFPEPVAESRIPRGAVLFVSIILVIIAYGGWYYLSSRDTSLGDLVPQAPQTMNGTAPLAPGAAAPPDTGSPPGSAADSAASSETKLQSPPSGTGAGAADATAGSASAPTPASARETAPPAATAAPPAALRPTMGPPASSEPPMPDVTAPPNSSSRSEPALPPEPSPTPETSSASGDNQTAAVRAAVEIRAKADSWVQIRGPGGRVVVMRIFRAGDSFRVPDEEGLTLMTGNAGAIEIMVDGAGVPAIGPFGAVRRDVALDPERLRAGTAVAR